MKNIHVLPTNKPSLLFVDNDDKKLRLYKATNPKYADNIYITNDEEIKEGDYGLGFALGIKGVGRGLYVFKQDGTNIGKLNAICNESKKIILTTDQDLIKDGVQAIDDEFLKWFVNNPSCEEVGVEVDLSKHNGKFQTKYGWKIIIPKEEPKQTAVEWYSQQHLKLLIKLENKELSIGEYAVQHQEILNKTKEMEKEQIKDAYLQGQYDGDTMRDSDAEQYYNETFKKK